MGQWLEVLAGGITQGAIYCVFAFGLSLVYGTTRIMNFAHGSFYMVGGYLAWVLSVGYFGFSYPIVFLIVVPLPFSSASPSARRHSAFALGAELEDRNHSFPDHYTISSCRATGQWLQHRAFGLLLGVAQSNGRFWHKANIDAPAEAIQAATHGLWNDQACPDLGHQPSRFMRSRRATSAGVGGSKAKSPVTTLPARWERAINTPFVVTLLSTSVNVAGLATNAGPSSPRHTSIVLSQFGEFFPKSVDLFLVPRPI